MRSVARWLKRLGLLLLVLVLAAVTPIVINETRCMQSVGSDAEPYQSILQQPWRRDLANTWLTYPEWSIVHAYEDFAVVARQRGEADFSYLSNIGGYWSRLCQLSGVASSRAPISTDVKAMLYIIGLSFSAEMAVKGAYESTIGRFTAWLRGPAATPEDQFTYNVNDEYAAFLRQTPWYEFPFADVLRLFWSRAPWSNAAITRSIERRAAMTMEYGVKAIYAKGIGALAGLAPADPRIRSVVAGLTDDDLKTEPRIALIEKRADGSAIVETPRYRAFTDILKGLSARGREFIEIAGQNEIFVTAIAANGAAAPATAALLFEAPVQAKPDARRLGLTLSVADLAALMRSASPDFAVEHVYDY